MGMPPESVPISVNSRTYRFTVTLANGTATGTAQLIAANGDSIYSTVCRIE
jgi:hypothetical protein